MKELVAATRELMPGVGIQIPPNLADWWPELVEAGATDLGGLSANGDHISPEHPFPSPHQVRKRLAQDGHPLAERLCVYARFIDPEWQSQGVLDVIKTHYWSFIPRSGSARREQRAIRSDLVPGAIAKGRDGLALSADELTALFAEHRPEAIEDMRQAADELRAEVAGEAVTFVVNRNINVSNICTVGCAFCGFGQGRRSPDAYEHSEPEFRGRVREAIDYGATEICMQSGIHPEWGLEDYEHWLRVAKDEAPAIHLHAYSPMEIAHMVDVSGLAPAEVFSRLAAAGLDSTPGTAAEILDDGVRGRISPNKLPAARWVEIIEASHAAGLRSTSTVMFGHIEEPWELAEHMRAVLRPPSREISSIPCVRPSSVWNGMKQSGTNSVNPPVRSCSARTTRMCSASSQGSSMWPNITVDVERRPAGCEASMISTQRATGSLFGRDPLAHAVVEDLGGGARRRAQPRLAQPLEHLARRRARRGRTCARPPSASRRAGGAGAPSSFATPQPAPVVLERPVGMDARLHADLGGAVVDRLADAPRRTPPRRARMRPASACPGRSRRTRSRPVQTFDKLMLRLTTNVTVSPASSARSSSAARRMSSIASGRRLGEQRGQLLRVSRRRRGPSIAPGDEVAADRHVLAARPSRGAG